MASSEGLKREGFYYRAAIALFLIGALLRVALYQANPAANSFDNHFEPILLLMKDWVMPTKDACWQCYHPPLFYLISAAWGTLVGAFGANQAATEKLLQLLPCIYGIITLPFIYGILSRLSLSPFSRTMGFGVAALLPRHIYMSAMHTNDTLSYLLVTVAIYLAIKAVDEGLNIKTLAELSIVMALALLTKITTLVVLPAVGILFLALFVTGKVRPRRVSFLAMLLVFLLPLLVLVFQAGSNVKEYGKPFPINYDFHSPSGVTPATGFIITSLPGKGSLSFTNFKPISAIKTPIVGPETVGSFWTLLYSRLWWDMKPKFLYLTKENATDNAWWYDYYDYLHGKKPWPGTGGVSNKTLTLGSATLLMALAVTLLMLLGFILTIFSSPRDSGGGGALRAKLLIFPVLILFNLAGVLQAAISFPIFSSMKAAYLLNSSSAFAVFAALALDRLTKDKGTRRAISIYLIAFLALITLHTLYFASGPFLTPPGQ